MDLPHDLIDRIIQSHFAFEAADDVEGVLDSLAEDAEHQIVPSKAGALRGREKIRSFYESLFEDLRGESVTPVRRLYGSDFVVDEAIWHGRVENGRAFLCPGKSGPVSFRILHVFEIRDGKIGREQVWCDLAAIQEQLGCEAR